MGSTNLTYHRMNLNIMSILPKRSWERNCSSFSVRTNGFKIIQIKKNSKQMWKKKESNINNTCRMWEIVWGLIKALQGELTKSMNPNVKYWNNEKESRAINFNHIAWMVVEPKESSILRLNEGVNAALSFSFQDEKFFWGDIYII
jgi:hypothetical protein